MQYSAQGKLIDFTIPRIMGIVNLSQDSFYDGGKLQTQRDIEARINQVVEEGADFIDFGAASSKPGSKLVDASAEWKLLEPVISYTVNTFPSVLVSIDTYNATTAKKALENGAHCINDISGGQIDNHMFATISQYNCIYICMHMLGTPQTMQVNPTYNNVLDDLVKYFAGKVQVLNKMRSVDVILDPGFGFGKSVDHNYVLLKKLSAFSIFDKPLLVGLSRKSMFYKPLGLTPDRVLPATLGMHAIALQNGANILRVHDVKEHVQLVKVFNLLSSN